MHKKKYSQVILLGLLVCGFLPFGTALTPPQSAEGINVVASTTLLADFVSRISGEEVDSIVDGGSCPGHYDPLPGDAEKVQNADVVFCHGFESFLDGLLAENQTKYPLYGLVGMVEWGVPEYAIRYLNVITAKLNETYPALASTFNTNLQTYTAEIEAKSEELLTQISDWELNGTKAVVMTHQTAFAEFLGLNVTGSWGLSDDTMSTQDIADLITLANDTDAQVIIMNRQSGTGVGTEVSNTLGIHAVIFSNFPGSVNGTETYLSVLEYNINILNEILQTEPEQSTISGFSSLSFTLALVLGFGVVFVIIKRQK